MSTTTRSGTDTTTITALDVREVFQQITTEIGALLAAAAIPRDFDKDDALVDVSLLALNGVIGSARLEYYLDGELVREHVYRIAHGPTGTSGPPADQPPTAGLERLPAGTRVRLTVTRSPGVSLILAASWYQRLGWVDAEPLHVPANMKRQEYGTFGSGGYGVHRLVATHPKYDHLVVPDEFEDGGEPCFSRRRDEPWEY